MAGKEYPEFPIIIVDDEETVINGIIGMLQIGGINNTIGITDSRKALGVLETYEAAIILLDLTMPNIPGNELLPLIREERPEVPVIIISGNGEVSIAVECMLNGAFDYLVKPTESAKLIATVKRAVEILELKKENLILSTHLVSNELENPEAFSEIITTSDKMRSVLLYTEAIACTEQTVLITGETGSGKELIAVAIHKLSRRNGDFVAANVAGFDDSVFSDTLFGHRKGAYTGADSPRKGLIESAAGGTLFLDEIGDLSQSSQIKLLRLLESREYLPLGSDIKKKSSARIVVATNSNLPEAVDEGGFRRDLFYRLGTHHVSLPPLRDRPEDIPLLVDHFAGQVAEELGIKNLLLPSKLARMLSLHTFPGNVRELRSILFDAVSRSLAVERSKDELKVSLDAFKTSVGEEAVRKTISSDEDEGVIFHDKLPTIREATDLLVDEAMLRAEGKQTLAAQMLGISQQALSKRLKVRCSS
jgi:DNA-binding NtrC family response regulator